MSDKAAIELNKVLLGQDMRELRDVAKLPANVLETIYKAENMTDHEKTEMAYSKAPTITFGSKIKQILSRIAPQSQEDSAELFVWIVKIHNAMITTKAELQLSADELKKLIALLGRTKADQLNVMVNGQIHQYLKELEAKLTLESSKPAQS